ncbi:hypothetical protein QTP88_016326 [Uroleucon formosanum]
MKKHKGNVNALLKWRLNSNYITEKLPSTSISSRQQKNIIHHDKDTEEIYVIKGRRIVDIKFMFDKISKIKHEGFDCTFLNLSLQKEKRYGFYSEFIFICNVCNKNEIISTEPSLDTNGLLAINMAVVSSAVNTGQGYSQLQQFSAILNMPCMSNPLYQKCHEKVSSYTESVALEGTKEAAKEEARLAIEHGDVNKNGVPMITVVADGAWSKRSYRSNYNALSGVGCIVGYRTKKVLYIGIRNKYCSVCHKADVIQKVPGEHICYKNWSGTSTAMEADIIVQGFKQSLQSNNLIYSHLIGDGDSSVMKKINLAKPYGNDVIVKKIECTNHILRNYSNRLKDISTKRKSSSGTVVPGLIRTKLKENLPRLRYSVTKAIEFRKNMTTSNDAKAKCLKNDITNGPYHIFGFHDECDEYFCKRKKESEFNLVPEMQKCGIWNDIMAAVNLVAYHSDSLIYHVNNNVVESYNSIVAKYVGGKRINFSFKGSYSTRCHTAVSSYNFGPQYLRHFHKKMTNRSPGIFTKDFISKHIKSQRQKQLRKSLQLKPRIQRKLIAGPDEDYGAVNEDLGCKPLLIAREEMEEQKLLFLSRLRLSQDDIIQLERRTIEQSQCEEWKKERSYRLTASNFGKVCKLRKSTNRKNTIISILYKSDYFHGTTATRCLILFTAYFKDAGGDNTKNLKKKSKILDYFKNKSEEPNEAVAHLDITHENVHNPQEYFLHFYNILFMVLKK